MRLSLVLAIFTTLFLASFAIADDVLTVTCDHADGRYEIGATITWTIHSSRPSVAYTIRRGQFTEIAKGSAELHDGVQKVTSQTDAPGTLLLEATAEGTDAKPLRALCGAVIAAEQIRLSAPRPADFDAFWDRHIAELRAVPEHAQLEVAVPSTQPAKAGEPEVKFWKITLDNIRGTHVRGQLARPAAGEKFPALLIVQWAGVYPLDKEWVTNRAAGGWLALNINPHDLPIDNPPAFYKAQFDGPLKDYWAVGNDDPDQSYLLRMYLSCYRAADYLASRPDWDGKTLVVLGASQGGLQAMMTAGLHPKITACLALVPAGCDMLGPDVGRRAGWPQWLDHAQGKDLAKVRDASRYYDVANFTPHIKCPTLIATGLIDEICPAEGVFAAANQITAPKEVMAIPSMDHPGTNNSQAAFHDRSEFAWLPALREGRPVPPPTTRP